MSPRYPFTEEESKKASIEWGANCGPNALAFALQVDLDTVRPLIPGFEEKRYTSPTMMKAGIAAARRWFTAEKAADLRDVMFSPDALALVRIQFTGPWTKPGTNPRWAYWHTHWICTWATESVWSNLSSREMLFDVNGGVIEFCRWHREILPVLTGMDKRSDGGWLPTHVWRLS